MVTVCLTAGVAGLRVHSVPGESSAGCKVQEGSQTNPRTFLKESRVR